MSMPQLTINALQAEAGLYAATHSGYPIPDLYGVTDGKAVGTYFELNFRQYLLSRYSFAEGNTASGIDFPQLNVDMKVTSIRQPQSSCPFKSARQKIYGLGYSILLFVYEKTDDASIGAAKLDFLHVIFVDKERTADYQITRILRETVARNGNEDDILAVFMDRNLPVDEIEARLIARDVLTNPPHQGYLTISNALQWRLQYMRVVQSAGTVEGVLRING